MPNWCGDTLQIGVRPGQESYGSRIPSRAHSLRAVSLNFVPPNDLKVQITEIYTSRTIAPCGRSEQFLIETGWKRKNPTNICSGAEMLDIIVIYVSW